MFLLRVLYPYIACYAAIQASPPTVDSRNQPSRDVTWCCPFTSQFCSSRVHLGGKNHTSLLLFERFPTPTAML